MKKNLNLICLAAILAFGLSSSLLAQNGENTPPTIYTVKAVANKTATVEGSLKDGRKLSSLRWASTSSNACFPATQNAKFTGNHVFFATDLPPHSIMTITVKPKNSGKNLSIYGYQIGEGKFTLPEDLQSCVTCEADHKWDYPKRGKVQTDARIMTFNAIANSYTIIIGVTGADGLTDADFTLEITLKQ
jgi:hypothetical protein